jgi:hypothetical protein
MIFNLPQRGSGSEEAASRKDESPRSSRSLRINKTSALPCALFSFAYFVCRLRFKAAGMGDHLEYLSEMRFAYTHAGESRGLRLEIDCDLRTAVEGAASLVIAASALKKKNIIFRVFLLEPQEEAQKSTCRRLLSAEERTNTAVWPRALLSAPGRSQTCIMDTNNFLSSSSPSLLFHLIFIRRKCLRYFSLPGPETLFSHPRRGKTGAMASSDGESLLEIDRLLTASIFPFPLRFLLCMPKTTKAESSSGSLSVESSYHEREKASVGSAHFTSLPNKYSFRISIFSSLTLPGKRKKKK